MTNLGSDASRMRECAQCGDPVYRSVMEPRGRSSLDRALRCSEPITCKIECLTEYVDGLYRPEGEQNVAV